MLGQDSDIADDEEIYELEALEVTAMRRFSDMAIPQETPVSFTEYGSEKIEFELGSRDIPLVLNTSPSVFATNDGGAAGDARVSIRGFSEINTNIMINGVPVNDIENGLLYWSNWDGIGGVASTIQIQRGLSNVSVPTPSIGGTMNIITKPADDKMGGRLILEAGSDSFYKGTITGSTGLLYDKFALTVSLVAKEGDGYADGTWTEGYAYYVGSSYQINEKNRLEFYALGAPQQHGQRSFRSNIAAYSKEYAKKVGYSDQDIQLYLDSKRAPLDQGLDFNPNYAPVDSSYSGQQWYWGGTHSRKEADHLNERVNYFHKPQINLNWYLDISDSMDLTTVIYYSGGRGGGSGTYGSVARYSADINNPNYDPMYADNRDWNTTIANNRSTPDGDGLYRSRGALRNSVNEQDQFGVISKLSYEISDEFTLGTGIDWRTAELHHFRELRDLLGGDYYIDNSDDFRPTDTKIGLGDKVNYYNTNTVDWIGAFLTGQYQSGPITAFGTYGYTVIDYSYVDHFRDDGTGAEYELNIPSIEGHQLKGGISYAINDQLSAFVNSGWVSRAPVFDGAIDDVTGQAIPDPENEEFTSYEVGVEWESKDKKLNLKANVYYTEWRERTEIDVNQNTITYQRGIDSDHSGIELEAIYQPLDWIRFDVAGSFAKWEYVGNVTFTEYDITTRSLISSGNAAYIDGLRIGDAPQYQLAYAVSFFPVTGLTVKLQGRWYDRYWSDYEATSRTDPADTVQPWKIPGYSVYDVHFRYNLPSDIGPFEVSFFAHVFNVFDKEYISDATDESGFESITAYQGTHTAQSAEVFFGAPRSYNFGVDMKF